MKTEHYAPEMQIAEEIEKESLKSWSNLTWKDKTYHNLFFFCEKKQYLAVSS